MWKRKNTESVEQKCTTSSKVLISLMIVCLCFLPESTCCRECAHLWCKRLKQINNGNNLICWNVNMIVSVLNKDVIVQYHDYCEFIYLPVNPQVMLNRPSKPCGHTAWCVCMYFLICGSLCEETKAYNPVWAYCSRARIGWMKTPVRLGDWEWMGMKKSLLLLYVKISRTMIC